jgi:preprotein translocase subunit YajC
MAAAMWLLLIRPQQQRVKQQRLIVESLHVGQRVVTAGGIIGTIADIDDGEIDLDVGRGMTLRLLRMAIARPLDPPALEAGEDID